jgi:hypothetical protein
MPIQRGARRRSTPAADTLAGRLEEVRSLAGVPDVKEFWRALGGAKGAGCGYETALGYHKGREAPVSYLGRVIATYRWVSPEWLLSGTGEPVRQHRGGTLREEWAAAHFSGAGEVFASAIGLDPDVHETTFRLFADLHRELLMMRWDRGADVLLAQTRAERPHLKDEVPDPRLTEPEEEELNRLLAEHIVAAFIISRDVLLGGPAVGGPALVGAPANLQALNEFLGLYRFALLHLAAPEPGTGAHGVASSKPGLLADLRRSRDSGYMKNWSKHLAGRILHRDSEPPRVIRRRAKED